MVTSPNFLWLAMGFTPRRHQLLPCTRLTVSNGSNYPQGCHLQCRLPSAVLQNQSALILPSLVFVSPSSSITYNTCSHTSYIHTFIHTFIHQYFHSICTTSIHTWLHQSLEVLFGRIPSFRSPFYHVSSG